MMAAAARRAPKAATWLYARRQRPARPDPLRRLAPTRPRGRAFLLPPRTRTARFSPRPPPPGSRAAAVICLAASPTSGSPSPPIRSRFTAATASPTSSILLLMLGDSSVFARIASVLDRRRRRRGHPRGKLCPTRPPRSPFLVGHHQDASRSLGHVVHAVTSHQTCRRAIRRHPVGSPSRTPLRASPPRQDTAPQDRVGAS